MGRGIDVDEGNPALDTDGDADVRQRVAGEALRVQGIKVFDQAVLGLEDLGVGDLDPLLAVGRDGIDPGPEEVAAHVFEQARIAHAADDVLVDAPGLAAVEDLALDPFVPDEHGEIGDRGPLRHGEDVGPLDIAPEVVDEDLVDRRFGDLVDDLDLDPVVLDAEGRDLLARTVVGDDEAVGPQRRRSGGQSGQRGQKNQAFTIASLDHRILLDRPRDRLPIPLIQPSRLFCSI